MNTFNTRLPLILAAFFPLLFLTLPVFAVEPDSLPKDLTASSAIVQAVIPPSLESASESWTLEDCLKFGLGAHPSLQQAKSQMNSAEARIGSAKATSGTKVNFQSGVTQTHIDFQRSAGPGNSNSVTSRLSDSLSAKQLIYDAGQVKQRVNTLETSLNGAKADVKWQEILVAGAIKTAFFRVLQTQALVSVQEHALAGFREHLEKARGLVEVGSRPPYDITKAEVDLANSQVSLIQAESNYANALSDISKAVGYEGKIGIQTPASQTRPVLPNTPWEEVWKDALSRPDLLSGEFASRASKSQISEAKKSKNPTLSSSANYDWGGTDTPLDRSWNIGLSLSVPVLDGKLQKFQIQEARSNHRGSTARVDQLRQAIRAETEVTMTNVANAFKRLEATEVLLRQASESLHLAIGRYDAGLSSPIEITDARVAYSSAEGNWVTAFYDSLITLANLDQVRGRFPEELPQGTHQPTAPVLPLENGLASSTTFDMENASALERE